MPLFGEAGGWTFGHDRRDLGGNAMSNKMWGGRFASGPGALMEEIKPSIDFDRHLYRQDIAASKAHADMLAKQGIITADDAKKIAHGLDTILSEIEAGTFSFKRALEDIHMNVESRLSELIGEPAGRLHTARSRNDQVATDFRLWMRDTIDALDAALAGFQCALAEKALAPGGRRPNSLAAVSARAFAREPRAAASIAAVHLSRLAEEIVLWTSPL